VKPHNIDIDGKTRPTSTKGFATPKTKFYIEKAEEIVQDDRKKPEKIDDAESKSRMSRPD
jgi:hypothetical protein